MLNDPHIFKNLEFQDYLIYGTDIGEIKVRKFPYMDIVDTYKLDSYEIHLSCLDVIIDNKFCVAWGGNGELHVFRDKSVFKKDTI